ncbi:MAG: polynucleotide adenylyltransferase PcnB [bacterium]|nr:MAG: polynucleotide adenylyltransferase PcnB [bacterium]
MQAPDAQTPEIIHPVTVPRSGHSISRSLIDPDALKVLYRLNRHGHVAYLVGGGVRDLLLGRRPKDFDISTSAHPAEIKKIFTNCRLIGKRFRLAHVYFRGGKIIEVSTFRTVSEFDSEEGLITLDNTFGTPWEDAFRRDFTVNALFYNIADFSVIDYVGGLEDLRKKVIRCIGDPEVRFREDPIRMLRGVRFAALLDFRLEEECERLIKSMGDEIWKGALPRILEEILRMMGRGTARRAMSLLEETGLLSVLFPEMAAHAREEGIGPYLDVLGRLDSRFESTGETLPWLILSCLLYPWFEYRMREGGDTDLVRAARESLTPVCQRIQVPRKTQDRMRQMLSAQVRLFGLGQSRFRPGTLLRKSYFEDAFTLFELVAATSEEGRKLISRWRELRGEPVRSQAPRKRSRRRRKRGPRPGKPPATG